MNKLTPADLCTLEDYARERGAFRARVLAHKQARTCTSARTSRCSSRTA